MTYEITVENPCKPTVTRTRVRRDAASLCFRKAVYDVLKGRALLDRPCAVRAMMRASEAEFPGINYTAVAVQESIVRFRVV